MSRARSWRRGRRWSTCPPPTRWSATADLAARPFQRGTGPYSGTVIAAGSAGDRAVLGDGDRGRGPGCRAADQALDGQVRKDLEEQVALTDLVPGCRGEGGLAARRPLLPAGDVPAQLPLVA